MEAFLARVDFKGHVRRNRKVKYEMLCTFNKKNVIEVA